MAEPSLQGALTNATYEFLGHQHRELFEAVRHKKPWLHRAALAESVLHYIDPKLARDVQLMGGIAAWADSRGGERPGLGTLEGFRAIANDLVGDTGGDNGMKEDLRWVGLAVLVAVASGALLLLLRKREHSASAATTSTSPATPSLSRRPIRIAIAAFSGKVRDIGAATSSAGDLLTHAAFWWAGPLNGWEGLARSAGLSTLETAPESDDALLVLVYEAPGSDGNVPSSRPEGATMLREAARANELRLIGHFAVSDRTNLSTAGFRR